MHTLPLATGPGTPRLVDVCNIQYTAVLSISGLPDACSTDMRPTQVKVESAIAPPQSMRTRTRARSSTRVMPSIHMPNAVPRARLVHV